MSISERILGKGKPGANGRPHIQSITPSAALPGGEVRIAGAHLKPDALIRPSVRFGEQEGSIVISADDFLVARVPDEATSGSVVIGANGQESSPFEMHVAHLLCENIHPVTSPAIDADGNIYSTLSGTRGQKVPVSVYKIDTEYDIKPFLSDIMNASGIAIDQEGFIYVSSRYEGAVYRVSAGGNMKTFAESMGVATGLAFDREGNLYVGDRSGTVFKISRKGETFVFATLEASVSAYHLAFGPEDDLYVTGPTTSSFDAVYRINPRGEVSEFYRGLGRPQGLAFDAAGNLYVAASHAGKRGIVRITPERKASVTISGPTTVGIAFSPEKQAIVTTTSGVYLVPWGIEGRPLWG